MGAVRPAADDGLAPARQGPRRLDAAHPMLPYLAQGAGMAIEDAAELGAALAQALDPALDLPPMLQR